MKRSLGIALFLFLVSAAQADIIYSGSVDPSPLPWLNWYGETVYIGKVAYGEIEVNVDDNNNGYWGISSETSYIGYSVGAQGTATVAGGYYDYDEQNAVVPSWSTADLYVGYEGTGTLNVTDGGYFMNINYDIWLGYEVDSIGTINVSGYFTYEPYNSELKYSSVLYCGDELCVGYKGTGTLNIENGGRIYNYGDAIYVGHQYGASGTISVTGFDSILLPDHLYDGLFYLGFGGEGELYIADGGTVDNRSSNHQYRTYVGYQSGSSGHITIDGVDSTMYCDTLYLGYEYGSTAYIDVLNGATLNTDTTYIGYGSNYAANSSIVTLTGENWGDITTWNASDLYVGYNGYGRIYVSYNSELNSNTAYIGYEGHGEVSVSGIDSGNPATWNTANSNIYVGGHLGGNGGEGYLSVGDHGTVDCGSGVTYIANSAGSYGHVTVTSPTAELRNHGVIIGSGGSEGNIAEGWLGLGNGGDVISGSTVNPSANSYIGYEEYSEGLVTIGGIYFIGEDELGFPVIAPDGAGWEIHGTLDVGYEGTGEVRLCNAANLVNGDGCIGNQAGSVGEVTLGGVVGFVVDDPEEGWVVVEDPNTPGCVPVFTQGSHWDNEGDLTVGNWGTGTLRISGGVMNFPDLVTSEDGYIGRNLGSVGLVEIGDPLYPYCASWQMNGSLYIGAGGEGGISGTGTLILHDGGYLTCNEIIIGSNGTLTLNGGGVALTDDLTFQGWNSTWGGNFNFTSGEFKVSSGADVTSQVDTTLTSNQTLAVTGSGSTWNCGSHDLILNGGALQLTDGAVLSDYRGYVGYGTNAGTATVDNATWTNSNNLYVGDSGQGTLNITNGGVVNSAVSYIGYNSGSNGTVTVGGSGSGSLWTNSGSLYVGNQGTGILNILTGGKVKTASLSAGTSGTINLNGGTLGLTNNVAFQGWNSTWGGTLNFTSGTFEVSGGADVTSQVDTTLASNQTLAVTGSGSTWNCGSHNLILNGGELQLTNGASLSDYTGYVGYGSNPGTATVDNATWTNSYILYVGVYGEGMLTIQNGGIVSNTIGIIGNGVYSSGEVIVSGNGSTWTSSSSLRVGNQGTGELSIINGGAVNCSNGLIAPSAGSTGTISVIGADSTLTNSGYFYVGAGGTGTLNVSNGGTVVTNGSSNYIGSSNGSMGIANISGTDLQGSSIWTVGGNLFVGRYGVGILNISDDGLVKIAGTLTIDCNNNANSFLNMADGGMLALYGDEDDSLIDFLSLVSGTDAIRWWDDSLDAWAPLTTATLGTDYTIAYQSTGGLAGYTLLTVTAYGPGDACTAVMPGDWGDGNRGVVPEPSTVALIFTALLAMGFAVIRKR